jgi:diacylglycerol kinase (ATP)
VADLTDDSTASPLTAPPARVPSGTRRALLFVNRRARSGAAPLDSALDVLWAGGIELDEHPCEDAGAIAAAIAKAERGVDCIIVGGGDGTLNCAAPALLEAGLPFGILPLGTANDLARTLGLPADPVAAAKIIVEGHRRPVDLGQVNGRPFFNVASIGFSAELARELTSEAKRRFGTLGYAFAAARLLARTRPFTVHIDHDGQTETVRTIQVSVGNGRHYGGGLTVEESAVPDDGLLDVYSLELPHWWHLLALVPSLRRGTHGQWRDVRAFKTTAVTVRTRRPHPINTDGELTGVTPAVFGIIPRALEVYAPGPDPS